MKLKVLSMRRRKKQKLILISPSGKEYQIGFLSPCTDGYVLGTSQLNKEEGKHLTVLYKKETILAHTTSQKTPEKRYFIPFNVKEFVARFQLLLENKMVFQLSNEQLSEDILYVTKKFEDWFNAFVKALYQKKTTRKEITHVLNFKKLFEELPKLLDEFKKSPQSFVGLCKAKDMLKDNSMIAGISTSRALIFRDGKKLLGIDFGLFTNLDFVPSITQSQINNPLNELLQSLGISQYIQEEVIEKKFLENLLYKENLQAPEVNEEANKTG